jgi:hypothetical protein
MRAAKPQKEITDEYLPKPEGIEQPAPEQPEFCKGFALTADFAFGLKDKRFTVIMPPKYIKKVNLDKPGEMIEKLVLTIELAQGKQQIDYFPNKTSQEEIIAERGMRLNDWVGYTGEFIVREQQIGKELRKVIYIKAKPIAGVQ